MKGDNNCTNRIAGEKKKGNLYKKINHVMTAALIVLEMAFGIKLMDMGVISGFLLLFLGAFLLLTGLLAFWGSKKRTRTIICTILIMIIMAAIGYGLAALTKLDSTLQKMSADSRLEVVQMAVVVRADGSFERISDIDGERVGCITMDDAADEVAAVLKADADVSIQPYEYENVLFLADALLEGAESAVIMNSAYIAVIADQDGYEEFADAVRVLYTLPIEVKTEAETPSKQQAEKKEENLFSADKLDEGAFVVYISGIDMWGAVNARSRSDVNILAAVNTRTGHIQLINTPRDYYVYLPNQGDMDKLTHAGLYGVDSSIQTLERLYDVGIDYYIRMNFSGYEAIIDILGGIDVYSAYDFTVEPIKHYTVGYNHLTGLEALAFARERYSFATGDVQRGRNQMEVITQVINKMTSPSMLANYSELLDSVSDCVQTDMPSDRIYGLVRYQLSRGTEWTVDSYTVTGTGTNAATYSMPSTTCYVMIPDDEMVAEAKSLIQNTLAEEE